MARQVRFGLLVEGSTDERFLPELVRRLIEQILNTNSTILVELLDPEVIYLDNPPSNQVGRILKAAEITSSFDLLIVHADCDKLSLEQAYRQRIEPGLNLITEARVAGQTVCEQVIGLIPQRMIEAWIIADGETLINLIGTNKNSEDLGLPKNLTMVEGIGDPKQILNDAVNLALADRTKRRRNSSEVVGAIYSQMGENINLSLLERLPSFLRFKTDLEDAFRRMGLIR